MTFRSRLLIAFALATIVPLAMLGVGVRRQLTARLVAQHQQRVEGMARVAAQDVDRESASIASRLSTLASALRTDDRFRLAAVRGDAGERAYLLDWAQQAMRTTGLDMLQLQDSAGRIVSSGHFRNEFDRLEPELPRALALAKSAVLVRARAPEGPFLALVRVDSVSVADRRFHLVGGINVDSAFLQRFAREQGLHVTVVIPSVAPAQRSASREGPAQRSASDEGRDPPVPRKSSSLGPMRIPRSANAPLGMTTGRYWQQLAASGIACSRRLPAQQPHAASQPAAAAHQNLVSSLTSRRSHVPLE